MISREVVERYLKANNVQPTASEDEIKEMLLRARWHETDVEIALTVLRENPETQVQNTDTHQHIFQTDQPLQAETISALLGIDIDLATVQKKLQQNHRAAASSVLIVLAVAMGLSATFVGVAMWILQMGPFYTG